MILITGGLGFLGANLAWFLAQKGEKVLVTRHRSSDVPNFLERYIGKEVQVVPFDILNLDSILSTLREYNITSVINLASTYEGKGTPYEACQINVQGHINVLEAAHRQGIRRITFASSRAVYRGMADTAIVRETDPIPVETKLKTSYITGTKRAGEAVSLLYADTYGMEVVLARIGSVYGPFYKSGRNPILMMVKNAVNGIPTKVALPEATGYDYIYVKDCVRAVGLLHLKHPLKYRIYNVGVGGKVVGVQEVGQAVRKAIPEAKIEIEAGGRQPQGVGMDISRIRAEIGYEPEFTLEKGVEAFIQWLKEGKY